MKRDATPASVRPSAADSRRSSRSFPWLPLLAALVFACFATTAAVAAPSFELESTANGESNRGEPNVTAAAHGDPLPMALVGRVVDAQAPIPEAAIYAYKLTDTSLTKAFTDGEGQFSFDSLPAGLYQVIAYKPGFLPAVALLSRAASSAFQYLDFDLTAADEIEVSSDDDFWSIRERIPRDILRQIELAVLESAEAPVEYERIDGAFEARMQALTGVEQLSPATAAELRGGRLDLAGQLGTFLLDVRGDFRELQPSDAGFSTSDSLAQSTSFQVRLANGDQSQFLISSSRSHLDRADAPIDLAHYGLSGSQQIGHGRAEFSAQFTEQSNFLADERLAMQSLPTASQTVHVEGSYETKIGQRNSLQTGVRYRQHSPLSSLSATGWLPSERFELFGLADLDVNSSIVVQYGLFTEYHDGRMSLSPQGGVVLKLSPQWSINGLMRQRFTDESATPFYDFVSAYYNKTGECGSAEANCYQIELTRKLAGDGYISVGALQREYADRLRLFFSDDFFNQLESLYLVEGDRLPEVHVAFQRRLTPRILARLESNVARGGGGFIGTSDGPFRNQVQYAVTSLDTRFDATDTGVLLAFHTMDQELVPLLSQTESRLETDRLQVLLTQDLPSLLGLASDWSVQLDMQLSRGADLYDRVASDDVRRRVVGGIAVRF